MRDKTPAGEGDAGMPDATPEASAGGSASAVDSASEAVTPAEASGASEAIAASAAHAGRGLKIALLSALAIVVALGVFVAFLMMRAPEATPQADSQVTAEPTRPAAVQVTPPPTPTAKPVVAAPQVPAAPPAPPPVKPAPVKPAAPAPPAPPAPPALPDPPTPLIPLTIDSMTATVQGECTTSSYITLSWTTTGAEGRWVDANIRSGSGSPVYKHDYFKFPPDGAISDWLDCTRSIWYFRITVSNATQTKTGLLTFVNGKTAGWSWGNP